MTPAITRLPWFVAGTLIAVFWGIALFDGATHHCVPYPDSARYLTQGLDFDAYAAPKALGVLAGGSLTGYCALSGVLHAIAWVALFLALLARCRAAIHGWLGAVLVPGVIGVLVLGHGLATTHHHWTRAALSESVSVSLALLTLASFLALLGRETGAPADGKRWLRWLLPITAALVISLSTVSQPLAVVGTATFLGWLLLILARHWWRPLAACFVLAVGLGVGVTVSSLAIGDSKLPTANVMGKRVLVNPALVEAMQARGMPVDQDFSPYADQWGDVGGRIWSDPGLRKWQAWAEDNVRSAYFLSMMETPLQVVAPLWQRFGFFFAFETSEFESRAFGNRATAYARFGDTEESRYTAPLGGLPEHLLPSGPVLAIWLALGLGLYLRWGWRDPACSVAFAFCLAAVPLALAQFHGDGAEVPRHLYPPAAQFQLGLAALILLCLFRRPGRSADTPGRA